MEKATVLPVLICIAALLAAGCTAPSASPAPATPLIPSPEVTVPAAATAPTPMNAKGCIVAGDCVPAQCCHPTSCINKVAKPDCSDTACTESCEGPLDCGAGSCGCIEGSCTIIATRMTTAVPAQSGGTVRIWATPQRYSPMMSSTPGIELTVITTGIDTSFAEYDWKASYGQFLSWNPPDYTVNQKGSSVTTNGGKIYWSYTEKPATTVSPVVITMTARDTATNKDLGRSTLTLDWDGSNAVTVREIV